MIHDRLHRAFRFVFWGLVLATTAALIATCTVIDRRPAGDAAPPLLLISIDGFRHDYLERGDLPSLDRLAREGLHADSLMHVFPTKTFVTHYALATGLYAEHTGVVANRMWDPERRSSFSLGNRDAVGDGFWYDGEPIWNTVEKAGRITAPFTWPGSAAQIGGMRPTIVRRYDGSVSHDERVDTVLGWLDLPPGRRPAFTTLYFSVVDSAGHRHGPEASETTAAAREVDRAIGRLLDGLEARGLLGSMHVLVTSDHGMEPIDPERYILLDEYFDLDGVHVSDWGPAAQIWTRDGGPSADEILTAVAGVPHLTGWSKGNAPERYRFDDHKRIPDVTLEADLGWMISSGDHFGEMLEEGGPAGMHGWDPAWHSMHGVFIAHGPAFTAGSRMPAVRSVDLYSLMAELLNVPPAETDGDLRAFENVLFAAEPATVVDSLWDCGERRISLRTAPGVAALHSARRVYALPRERGASGERYAEPGVLFWNRGDEARIELDGQVWPSCRRIVR